MTISPSLGLRGGASDFAGETTGLGTLGCIIGAGLGISLPSALTDVSVMAGAGDGGSGASAGVVPGLG